MAVDGHPPAPGEQLILSSGSVVEVVEVEHPDAHLYAAVAFYGDRVRALQLVWADRRGRWPWTPDFDDGRVDNRCWACGLDPTDLCGAEAHAAADSPANHAVVTGRVRGGGK